MTGSQGTQKGLNSVLTVTPSYSGSQESCAQKQQHLVDNTHCPPPCTRGNFQARTVLINIPKKGREGGEDGGGGGEGRVEKEEPLVGPPRPPGLFKVQRPRKAFCHLQQIRQMLREFKTTAYLPRKE